MVIPEAVRPAANAKPALSIRRLTKTFGANRALNDFSLTIVPGEIHALVGSNGSGKSTVIKILSGYHLPDPAGEILVNGRQLAAGSATSAYRLGCRFVHQDLGLIGNNSILDNLSLTAGYPTTCGTIRSAAAKKAARAALAVVGLDRLDLRKQVSEISAAERTGVAVARAVRDDADHPVRVIVLDEPTATMPADEVDRLLDMIRAIASRGVAVLFVTHHLQEVFRVADKITVLRDGNLIATHAADAVDHDALVGELTGDAVEPVRADAGERAVSGEDVLQVTGLTAGPLRSVSLSARPGEILGIAGLTGSGRESLLGAVFGRIPRDAGQVQVSGTLIPPGRPDLSMRASVAYLPPDRRAHGGIMELSARENLSLTSLRPFWNKLHLSRKSENTEAKRWFTDLKVRPSSAVGAPLSSFSGGNQQKILFAKWIRRQPELFLLDEPTQGVDIGAKADLHRELLRMAGLGTAIVISSTDTDELSAVCDRVVIMRNGRIADELAGTRVTATEIDRCCLAASEKNRATPA